MLEAFGRFGGFRSVLSTIRFCVLSTLIMVPLISAAATTVGSMVAIRNNATFFISILLSFS
jgi:hypothetical protein